MNELTNFINNHFDIFIAVSVFWFIGGIVIFFASRIREVNTKKAINKLLFYVVCLGEAVLLLTLLMTFQVNLKEKGFLVFEYKPKDQTKYNFADNVLPTTDWVKDKLTIYFIADKELVSIDASGKGRKIVFNAEDPIRAYHFSPNGKHLLVLTDQQMYQYDRKSEVSELIETIDISGTKENEIKGVIGAVAWAPGSDRFCYRIAKWTKFSSVDQWYVYDLGTKKKRRITSPSLRITSLQWSKDGNSLYYAWFGVLDENIYANPYEVKIYEFPLATLEPALILRFPYGKKEFPEENLALHGIEIFSGVTQRSYGRAGQRRYSWESPRGDVIGVDEGDHLYYIRNHWWRRKFLDIRDAFLRTEFARQWDNLISSNRALEDTFEFIQTWAQEFSEKKWRIRSVDIPDRHKMSIWRRRLFKIPRVERETSDFLPRYQYEGGRLAIQYLRWFPSGRYVIMEHHFFGILILEPASGKVGILVNEKGNTFGWFTS